MVQFIRKSEQFNDIIFNGQFHANKPVFYGGEANVYPYSNLFYWSNAYTSDICEFGLHPHEGFEIMSFLLEGTIDHYDTATQVWTPLQAGDFQIIQANSGVKHRERIGKNSRAFQIWFDPNFQKAIRLKPAYTDYHSQDFQPKIENGIKTITYVGSGSIVEVLTPHLRIKKLIFEQKTKANISLDEDSSYTFYVLNGNGTADNQAIAKDDALRIIGSKALEIDFLGELFYIQTPAYLDYKPVWE